MVMPLLKFKRDTQILVLFSRAEGIWKIADFGLSTEATSQHARTTLFSNGTPSYRAPELLKQNPKYTNKVDIWALGCILYELLCEQKLFSGDWDVLKDAQKHHLISIPVENQILREHFSGLINEMLASSWESRPRALEISNTFRAYSLLFDPSHCHSADSNSVYFPSYLEWKGLLERDKWNDESILYDVGKYYVDRGFR